MAAEIQFISGHENGDPFVIVSGPAKLNSISLAEFGGLAIPRELGVPTVIRLVHSESVQESRAMSSMDPDFNWFMDVRNPDGSAATTSANGVRVASAFLTSEKLVTVASGERFAIDTRDGELDIQAGANGLFRVDLGRWRFGQRSAGTFGVQLGGPHTVTVLKSLAELDALELPDIATAEKELVFAAVEQPLVDDGIGRLRFRVFRPGVGEVASSGTAAAAAALAMRHNTGASTTHNWRAESRGGSIGIQMFPTEVGEHVSIHGHAALTATGQRRIRQLPRTR